jgi:multicomponent Na+:H+ antiporter subunit G
MIVASYVLMSLGLLLIAISTLGLLLLPEIYTRAHAVATSETLGLLLVFAGLYFRPELDLGSAGRLALILIFALIANPTAVHALVRAARRAGIEPWKAPHRPGAEEESR